MATLSRAEIDGYTRTLNAISKRYGSKVSQLLANVDLTDKDGSIKRITEIMRTACAMADEEASVASIRFYDAVRKAEIGKRSGVTAPNVVNAEATDRATRGIVYGSSEASAIVEKLAQRIDYEVKRSAFIAMQRTFEKDPAKPRFARVPSGSETCEFCLMLASRGFVYTSAKNAGEMNHWHASCDCRVIPSFKSGTSVEGFSPDKLKERFYAGIDAKAAARAEANGTEQQHERAKIIAGLQKSAPKSSGLESIWNAGA